MVLLQAMVRMKLGDELKSGIFCTRDHKVADDAGYQWLLVDFVGFSTCSLVSMVCYYIQLFCLVSIDFNRF